jgi:hypothetical protein
MAEGPRGLVVLTPDGEFVEVPGRSGAIGEEIGFEPPLRRTALHRRLLLTASAAAVLLLFAIGLARMPIFHGPQVAAYVAIDINPSVEIGVDKHRSVVELQALNEDGERVIEGIAYRKRPVGEVTADIILSAEAADYLRDGGEVFVTSMTTAGTAAQFEKELMRVIDQAVQAAAQRSVADSGGADAIDPGPGSESGSKSESRSGAAGTVPDGSGSKPKNAPKAAPAQNIAVTIVSAPDELRKTAQANGVSPGKMAVYLLAEKQGLSISLDDLKTGSIRKAVEPYGGISNLLGDGQSDEERKRELAELLAKEEAKKAKDNALSSGGGKAASANDGKQARENPGKKTSKNDGKKASDIAGKKPSASAGTKEKRHSRPDGMIGNAKKPGDKADKNRHRELTAGGRRSEAANSVRKPEPETAGGKRGEAANSVRKPEPETAGGKRGEAANSKRKPEPETAGGKRSEAANSVRKPEPETAGGRRGEAANSVRKPEPETAGGKRGEAANSVRKPEPETAGGRRSEAANSVRKPQDRKQQEQDKLPLQNKRPQQDQQQGQKNRPEQNWQQEQKKQQERDKQQDRNKQGEKREQKRVGFDKNRSSGQHFRGRRDDGGERNAYRQQEDRRVGQNVQLAGFARFGADFAASAGDAGPGRPRQ